MFCLYLIFFSFTNNFATGEILLGMVIVAISLNLFYLKSKLQKSSFMLTLDCKLCHLSSKSIKNVLNVCKPLQVMSFSLNSIIFYA
ncbi:hypothetical protein Hanom_Chr02g00106291 [Helianthus anomalus]